MLNKLRINVSGKAGPVKADPVFFASPQPLSKGEGLRNRKHFSNLLVYI